MPRASELMIPAFQWIQLFCLQSGTLMQAVPAFMAGAPCHGDLEWNPGQQTKWEAQCTSAAELLWTTEAMRQSKKVASVMCFNAGSALCEIAAIVILWDSAVTSVQCGLTDLFFLTARI